MNYSQKWYDKPISKIILVTISLTWMFPYIGFLLSSFREPDAVRESLGGIPYLVGS